MPRLKVRLLQQQAEFINCKDEWHAARGGVGSGKTLGAVWWIIKRLEDYPKANHVVVGSDYDQLRRGFFQSLLQVLEETLGLERGTDFTYRENPTPLLRFVRSGARLRSMSAELAQRVRSVEIQTLYLEEPQTWHNGNGKDTYSAIADRMRHSVGSYASYPDMPLQGRMTLNPPAVGTWLYDLIEKKWPEFGYKCLRFSLRHNVLLPKLDDYLRRVMANNDPERWPVEIDGHWATIGGNVYRGFDVAIHGAPAPAPLPPVAIDKERPLLWCLDFNVDWMSSLICQAYVQPRYTTGWKQRLGLPPIEEFSVAVPAWQRRIFYVLREMFMHDVGTPDVVRKFVEEYGQHCREYTARTGKPALRIYGDASGGSRSQTISSQDAARSNWEIVMQELHRAGIVFEMFVPTTNPSVMDRINAVRAQFKSGEGFGMFVDTEACPELVTDFFSVRFKPGLSEIDKDKKSPEGLKRTHLSDALGYLVWYERELAKGTPPRLKDFFVR